MQYYFFKEKNTRAHYNVIVSFRSCMTMQEKISIIYRENLPPTMVDLGISEPPVAIWRGRIFGSGYYFEAPFTRT